MAFDVGDSVALSVDITEDGTAVNATTITLTVTLPDASEVVVPVANPPLVTGHYTVEYVTTVAGRHVAEWVATGPEAAHVDTFTVVDMSRAIVSLDEAKAHLNTNTAYAGASTIDDEELRGIILAATDECEGHPGVGAIVRRTVVERIWHQTGEREIELVAGPVLSVTSVTSVPAGSTISPGVLYHAGPRRQRVQMADGTGFVGGLYEWTYVVGREVVEGALRLAALEIVRHLWESQRLNRGRKPQISADPAVPGVGYVGYAKPRKAIELLDSVAIRDGLA